MRRKTIQFYLENDQGEKIELAKCYDQNTANCLASLYTNTYKDHSYKAFIKESNKKPIECKYYFP